MPFRSGARRITPLLVVALLGLPGILVSGFPFAPDANAASGSRTAWAWGDNTWGQLGNGTTGGHSSEPVAVSPPSGISFRAISAGGGSFGLALDFAGHAWAWGNNNKGQLGNGTTTDSSTPVAASMPSGVTFTAVSAACAYSLALDTTGQAWAWGSNLYGNLGDGTTTDSSTPVAVSMPPGVTFMHVAAGCYNAFALDTTGQAWAWGTNNKGQLGNGTISTTGCLCSSTPTEVSMPSGVKFAAVSGARGYTIALDTNGRAWGWGENSGGWLGDGTTTDSTTPVAVSMPSGVAFTALSAREAHTIALDTTGAGWAWGSNTAGGFGDGTCCGNSSTPVAVSMPSGVTFGAVATGCAFSLAVDSTGRVWQWGARPDGGTSCGSTTDRDETPVQVSMPSGVTVNAVSAGWKNRLALDGSPPASSQVTPPRGPRRDPTHGEGRAVPGPIPSILTPVRLSTPIST